MAQRILLCWNRSLQFPPGSCWFVRQSAVLGVHEQYVISNENQILLWSCSNTYLIRPLKGFLLLLRTTQCPWWDCCPSRCFYSLKCILNLHILDHRLNFVNLDQNAPCTSWSPAGRRKSNEKTIVNIVCSCSENVYRLVIVPGNHLLIYKVVIIVRSL